MPHLHTQPGQYDATVSAFIVRLDTPEPSVMLHRHKKLKTYFQFGGHVELSENPWQAITHEIAEESGYVMEQLAVLQPHPRLVGLTGAVLHPYPVCLQTHRFAGLDHYHSDTSYAFVAREPPRHSVAVGESPHIELFTATELRDIAPSMIVENVREIGLFVLEHCLSEWEHVPATI
jgi:8-oxo-dGTP diphosphatase